MPNSCGTNPSLVGGATPFCDVTRRGITLYAASPLVTTACACVCLQAISLEAAFEHFSSFGANRASTKIELDNAKFIKMLKETGIITKKFTSNAADILFTKVKKASGRSKSRKLDYEEFMSALRAVADEKGVSMQAVEDKICKGGGPKSRSTKAAKASVTDRLTDTSGYTGMPV